MLSLDKCITRDILTQGNAASFWGSGFGFGLSILSGAMLHVRFDSNSSRLHSQSQFTRCLNYWDERSLYTKSHSQVLGGTGMREQTNQGCVHE